MSDETNSLQPGSDFGQHRIVRLLGQGAMGEVYEVEHEPPRQCRSPNQEANPSLRNSGYLP